MRFEQKKHEGIDNAFVMKSSREFNIHPIVMEQIIARGNNTTEKIAKFLKPTYAEFYDPFLLKGMKALVKRVNKAKENKETVLIFGDYDVDGVSATAVMLKALKVLGINAFYYLPNRYIDGYGLTNEVIEKIKEKFNPSLIITVDCGISCHDEVEFAKTLGIEIIVTDHHEIPEQLPEGIVVNAKIKEQDYPFHELCGTGLAYKVATALIGKQAEDLLPIVCIATIADIVELTDENRAIVHFGMKKMEKLPIGILALCKKLKVRPSTTSSNEISFKIAPKLNASGRMGDADASLQLYINEDLAEINKYVNKIIEYNEKRKELCDLVENDCNEILSHMDTSAPAIILSSKNWDQGILGIICAKLVSIYNRPVFLFSEKDGEMVGSARSIPGINVHTLLASFGDILESYGGHPVAAGLTLRSENFGKFVEKVNDYLFENIDSEIFVPVEYYDVKINTNQVSEKLLRDLRVLEPCGHKNETIKFMIESQKFAIKPMEKFALHCNILPSPNIELIFFNFTEKYSKLTTAKNLKIIFEFQISSYWQRYRGIVKNIECDFKSDKLFTKNFCLPYINQLNYLQEKQNAKFVYFSLKDKEIYKLKSCFGTAVVVNSPYGFKYFNENFDKSKIIQYDIYKGKVNLSSNTLFVCPENMDFARSFKKIIFLDPIIDYSYIAKINSISNAEIYVPNFKASLLPYKNLNLDRNTFANIYKDIIRAKKHFYSLLELYEKIKQSTNCKYYYQDFYSAVLVFNELGFIKYQMEDGAYYIEIFHKIKKELNQSLLYEKLLNLQEVVRRR